MIKNQKRNGTICLFLLLVFIGQIICQPNALANAWPEATIGGGLGVQIKPERATEDDYSRIEAMGIRYLRYDIRWREVEYQKGRYDWRRFDDYIAALRAHHLKLVAILNGGNEIYSGMVKVPPKKAFGLNALAAAPVSDTDVAAFAAFAAAAVQRYGTDDIVWEIWNEPDNLAFWPPTPNAAAYAKLMVKTCAAIRQVAPNAIITGPALARMPDLLDQVQTGFLETILSSPVSTCINAISVHPYRLTRPPETAARDYNEKVKPLIAARTVQGQKTLPIFNSEWGYPSSMETMDQQQAYALRMRLTDFMNNVPLSIIYEYKDSYVKTLEADNVEQHFGLFGYDGSSKPAGLFMDGLLPSIKNATFVKRLPLTNTDDYVLLLKQPDGHYALLAWVGRSAVDKTETLSVNNLVGNPIHTSLTVLPQLIEPIAENSSVSIASSPSPENYHESKLK